MSGHDDHQVSVELAECNRTRPNFCDQLKRACLRECLDDQLLDPSRYTGLAGAFVDRVLNAASDACIAGAA